MLILLIVLSLGLQVERVSSFGPLIEKLSQT